MEKILTPMMQQWSSLKKEAPHCLLLFRMGDFYECFHDDATLLARDADVTLTQRQQVPMSGIPAHALDRYIESLLEKGHKLAIAEQTTLPKEGKGLVMRKIVRILSKATYLSETAHHANQFFITLTQVGSMYAMACIDTTTGNLSIVEKDTIEDIHTLLLKKAPHEILVDARMQKKHALLLKEVEETLNTQMMYHDPYAFDHELCTNFLLDHFCTKTLSGFGIEGMLPSINAAGALLQYLKEKLYLDISHVQTIKKEEEKDALELKHHVCMQLQVLPHNKEISLFSVLNKTKTAMGSRLLYQWVSAPLTCCEAIERRQEGIKEIHQYDMDELGALLATVHDLERLTIKIISGSPLPKDFNTLRRSLEHLPSIQRHLSQYNSSLAKDLMGLFHDLSPLYNELDRALSLDPPVKIGKGLGIKTGYNEELDSWVAFKHKGQEWLVEYQEQLKVAHNIKNLKVGYSRSFGYYIDLPRSQSDKAPSTFTKRQTLVNNERFIDPKLQAFEEKSSVADERLLQLEKRLYEEIATKIGEYKKALCATAAAIGEIDALYSLSIISSNPEYTCPKMDTSTNLCIQQGYHPLVMDNFIPNDIVFDQESRLLLMTGPNMAGKSTYLKMTALLVIMAQLGCFIPAKKAHIGMVDKIFTRIGAHDQLMRGHSTFMVEMTETAQILHEVTDRSLVLLDEIGRGTSTYDGMAIAHSVMEELINTLSPRTIFATHYSELSQYEKKLSKLKNIHIVVKEEQDNIYFMYKVKEGASNRSYGIDVAKIAGVPRDVIVRAKQLLKTYESAKPKEKKQSDKDDNQLLLFSLPNKSSLYASLGKELEQIEVNQLTPLEALTQIHTWKKELSNDF